VLFTQYVLQKSNKYSHWSKSKTLKNPWILRVRTKIGHYGFSLPTFFLGVNNPFVSILNFTLKKIWFDSETCCRAERNDSNVSVFHFIQYNTSRFNRSYIKRLV